ncbi:multidrug efflux system [Georgfuchsia toluolica]|uniref:Multidrug efflux system n=1 Tax=Georgfuchsia toluolica TaxID=424218 RepID=A0A916J2H3_9PROT|nr:HlyD family efflux transporter periplasmic adaptor subunit [Georgfuchsia toluolica]CAG4882781.1 multidrug efflux system [Georgfuchsia toluolica]
MNQTSNSSRRKRILSVLIVIFVLAGIAWALYWGISARYHETTDDAYVGGNLLRITPRVSGTIVAVLADDTDFVRRGQVLVKLDDTDARMALLRSEAELADSVRRVRQNFHAVDQYQANVVLKEQMLAQAEADAVRRAGAAADQSISQEELEHARIALRRAQSELKLANAQLAAARAAVRGTRVESHPAVRQTAARLHEAYLALARCEVRAPGNGYVAKRSIQVGQQVAVGAPLLAVVPLDQLWAEVNFKEDQLERVRIGQPVTVTSDFYGRGVEFHGKVVGVGAGTGAVFSQLPPQNASGNWIKIVQRLPVRISLDADELAKYPLRVGLSLRANVDTHDLSGPVLGSRTVAGSYGAPVDDTAEKYADKRVSEIIATNLGGDD